MHFIYFVILYLYFLNDVFENVVLVSSEFRASKEKDAPFMVSIRRTEFEENFGIGHHHCSGALIDPMTVVTSASCLYDTLGNPLLQPRSFLLVAGSRYLTPNSGEHGVIREVDQIVQHPEYNPVDNSNDVAYLKTVIPFDTTSGEVRPIDISDVITPRDSICRTYGWGWVNGNDTKIRYSGEVRITHRPECIAIFDKYDIALQVDKICGKAKYQDSKNCTNIDSGGILVCYEKLVGITSISSDCRQNDFPTVFTHISRHLAFLKTKREYLLSKKTLRMYAMTSSSKVHFMEFGMIFFVFILILN